MGKFKIPLSSLPPPNEDGNHIFRFRVTSEDKVRVSEYSTLYIVQSSGQVFPEQKNESKYRIAQGAGSTIVVTWEAPEKYNFGNLAVTDYNTSLGVDGIIISSGSAVTINTVGIVPNIYFSSTISSGATKTELYKFYEKVSRSNAQKVIDKILLQAGVISASIDEFILTPVTRFPDQSTKWGVAQVDIFVQYPANPSASTSASFSYYGRTREGQVSFVPEAAGIVRVVGQAASYPTQINEKYKIFDTGLFNPGVKEFEPPPF